MSNAPEIVGFIILLIAAAAGVIGYFKANVSKSTIELYKEDNEALRARLSTLEAQAVQDSLEIKALKSAQQYLQSVVTQADAISGIRVLLERVALKVGA